MVVCLLIRMQKWVVRKTVALLEVEFVCNPIHKRGFIYRSNVVFYKIVSSFCTPQVLSACSLEVAVRIFYFFYQRTASHTQSYRKTKYDLMRVDQAPVSRSS